MGILTILKSNGTWAVQGNTINLSSTGSLRTPIAVLNIATSNQVNLKNEVTDALDCVLLYWAIKVTVNSGSSTPFPFMEFRLLRNSVTTIASITFDPLETGTKAQLLNIPFSFNEHFNYEVQQFGSGNTFWTYLFAGKMSAPSIP